MEIVIGHTPTETPRSCERVVRKTLKNGTVKEYRYTMTYVSKSDMIQCNKTSMQKRITNCKDRDILTKLEAYMTELGM